MSTVVLLAIAGVLIALALIGALVFWRVARPSAGRGPSLEDVYGEVFGERAASPGPAARRWALGVLWEAGVDADSDRRYAARILQRAEPRLTRRAASALVDALA